MALGIALSLVTQPQSGSGGGLSNDTSLSVFNIVGQAVTDGGTLNLANSYDGTALVDFGVVVTPTHVSATVGTISLTPDPLAFGVDSVLEFTVTAEDGVTTQLYNVTLHVLTVGVAETADLDFTSVDGNSLVTGGVGKSFLYADLADPGSLYCFWFCVDGIEVAPSGISGVTSYIQVNVSSIDDDSTVANSVSFVMAGASAAGPVLIVTQSVAGAVDDPTDVDCGVIVSVFTQGEDPS